MNKKFYIISAPSGIHLGNCLVACGENKQDLPPVRRPQIMEVFDSRADAVEEHPYWEVEIQCA